MQKANNFVGRMFAGRKPLEPEKPLLEQLKEQIDLAQEFDTLQSLPAWEKILRYVGAEVNSELMDATRNKLDPKIQAVYVTRWDAKREIVDKMLGYIESAQRERDRIVEEYREAQHGGSSDNGN